MRRNVAFKSEGALCRGWLEIPGDLKAGERRPGIVLANGFSAVKEMGLPGYTRAFAEAGFVSLAFDYRYFGESEGEPRGQLYPLEQAEDYRNAITFLQQQPEVDPARIGAWGTSLSGSLALHVAAFDRRVKAVVAQVASTDRIESGRRRRTPAQHAQLQAILLAERSKRMATDEITYIPVVATEGMAALPGLPAYTFFTEAAKTAPTWRNEITLHSLDKLQEFSPAWYIDLISPTPLLLIVALRDSLSPAEITFAVYEKALPPKRLVTLPIDHFDIYTDPWLARSAQAAADWFSEWLAE